MVPCLASRAKADAGLPRQALERTRWSPSRWSRSRRAGGRWGREFDLPEAVIERLKQGRWYARNRRDRVEVDAHSSTAISTHSGLAGVSLIGSCALVHSSEVGGIGSGSGENSTGVSGIGRDTRAKSTGVSRSEEGRGREE